MGAVDSLFRSMCEGKFQASNNKKCFGECDKDIRRGLNPHVYALFWRDINVMLQHAGVDHGDRDKKETGEDSTDWAEVDLKLAKDWINAH